MPDFVPQTPDHHREMIRNAVLEEIRRAQVQDYGLADRFLEGNPAAVNWVKNALRSGDPDSDPASWDPQSMGPEWQELRQKQLAGFAGRGWSQDRIDQWRAANNAYSIPDRLLTDGGRQANDWQANRELIDGYLKARTPAAKPKSSFRDAMLGGTAMYTKENPQRDYENSLNTLAEEYKRKHGSQYGESGWSGFMDNPAEYTVPGIIDHAFDRGYHAFDFGWFNERSDGTNKGFWNALVDDVPNYLNLRRAAGQVEPAIPGSPKTPDEHEAATKSLRQMLTDANPRTSDATAFDDYYRRNNSHYPSYLGSTGVEFAKNIFSDPSILATGGMSGAGALKIATGPAMKTIRGLPLRWHHALHPLGHELGEEATMYGALAVPMTMASEADQAQYPEEYQRPVPFGRLWEPGNDARTDIPKAVREMPQTDWLKRDQAIQKKREEANDAARKVVPSLPNKKMFGNLNVTPTF